MLMMLGHESTEFYENDEFTAASYNSVCGAVAVDCLR